MPAGTIAGVEHDDAGFGPRTYGGPTAGDTDPEVRPGAAPAFEVEAVAELGVEVEAGLEVEAEVEAELEVEVEVEIDESLLDSIEQDLADVERALAMIDDGTYGHCDVCGNAIDDADLSTAPATRFCPDHLPLTLR